MEKQVFLTSFDHYSIERARSLDPDIELGLVIYGATPSVFPYLEQIGARYVSVKYVYVTPSFMEEARKRGSSSSSGRRMTKRYWHPLPSILNS